MTLILLTGNDPFLSKWEAVGQKLYLLLILEKASSHFKQETKRLVYFE